MGGYLLLMDGKGTDGFSWSGGLEWFAFSGFPFLFPVPALRPFAFLLGKSLFGHLDGGNAEREGWTTSAKAV